jgi:hypothetical protein
MASCVFLQLHKLALVPELLRPEWGVCVCVHVHVCVYIYRVSQEERSIFWEVNVLVILSKKYMYYFIVHCKLYKLATCCVLTWVAKCCGKIFKNVLYKVNCTNLVSFALSYQQFGTLHWYSSIWETVWIWTHVLLVYTSCLSMTETMTSQNPPGKPTYEGLNEKVCDQFLFFPKPGINNILGS